MLVTIGKLNVNFDEDTKAMNYKLQELKRLEQAIEGSTHYKLLSGKTQMMSRGKGKVKKERSRLVHTKIIAYQVVKPVIEAIYDRILQENPAFQSEPQRQIFELNKQIAVTRGLCMIKAHDIGHVAFGHEGERAIDEFVSKIKNRKEVEDVLAEHLQYFGEEYERKQGHIGKNARRKLSFEHNELGAILLNQIIATNGIDISDDEKTALTLGVLGHSTSRTPFELLTDDLVAQIVRVADKVEYINSDYDEVAGLVKVDTSKLNSEQIAYLQKPLHKRIAETDAKLVDEAFEKGAVFEKNPTMRGLAKIRKSYDSLVFLYDGTYADDLLKEVLALSDDPKKLRMFYRIHPGVEALYPMETLLIFKQYRKLLQNAREKKTTLSPKDMESAYDMMATEEVHFKSVLQGENSDRISLMYAKVLQYYYDHQDEIPLEVTREVNPIDNVKPETISYRLNPKYDALQRTLEYISLMDDSQMRDRYYQLTEQRVVKGENYGIEPITMIDIKELLRKRYDAEVEKSGNTFLFGARDNASVRGRKEYSQRSKAFFQNGLTGRGMRVLEENYEDKFQEYADDYRMYNRMLEMDEIRRDPKSAQRVVVDRILREGVSSKKPNGRDEQRFYR